jgi:type IV secretion system protein VirB8
VNKDKTDYFENSRNFENSKTNMLKNSTRRAWYIAYGCLTLSVLSVVAVVGLTPLKKVVPFVVRVDNATGIVDVVETMRNSKTNYDEVVSKYFVRQYIRFREGYSPDQQIKEEYYRNVGFMSSQAEQQKYFEYFNPSTNKNSPLNLYGNHGRINTIIKSISFVDADKKVALVRFIREINDGRDVKQTHLAATVTFKYLDGAGIEESIRAINPLGFQVTEYRVDADSDSDLTPSKLNLTQSNEKS